MALAVSRKLSVAQGDWRGISRHYVNSRTPTQVASHAQKHFMRQSNNNKRKRRASLFDMVSEFDEVGLPCPAVKVFLESTVTVGCDRAATASSRGAVA